MSSRLTLSGLTDQALHAARLRKEGADLDSHLPEALKGFGRGIGLQRALRHQAAGRKAMRSEAVPGLRQGISFSFDAGPYRVKVDNHNSGKVASSRELKIKRRLRPDVPTSVLSEHGQIVDEMSDQIRAALRAVQRQHKAEPKVGLRERVQTQVESWKDDRYHDRRERADRAAEKAVPQVRKQLGLDADAPQLTSLSTTDAASPQAEQQGIEGPGRQG